MQKLETHFVGSPFAYVGDFGGTVTNYTGYSVSARIGTQKGCADVIPWSTDLATEWDNAATGVCAITADDTSAWPPDQQLALQVLLILPNGVAIPAPVVIVPTKALV